MEGHGRGGDEKGEGVSGHDRGYRDEAFHRLELRGERGKDPVVDKGSHARV
jgi:hypothetical protein